jgi:hypothetical protein
MRQPPTAQRRHSSDNLETAEPAPQARSLRAAVAGTLPPVARYEFSEAVKRALCDRVASRCSFPGCRVVTSGPSSEGPMAVSRTGMACHIAAASGGPGARRVVPEMTPEVIASFDNGIWMCYRHGKLIDTDETRYTIPMLKAWRRQAEEYADLIHRTGADPYPRTDTVAGAPLGAVSFELEALGTENEKIGEAVLHSGIAQVWGNDLAPAIRDLAIEVVRNAFTHGKAKRFELSIEPHRVVMRDDGTEFGCQQLLRMEKQSGGAAAYRTMLDQHSKRTVVASRRNETWNETVVAVVQEPSDVFKVTPCALEFHAMLLHDRGFSIPVLSDCDVTYIVMPVFMSYSDANIIVRMLAAQMSPDRRYVIATPDISDGVAKVFEQGLPNCTLMRF